MLGRLTAVVSCKQCSRQLIGSSNGTPSSRLLSTFTNAPVRRPAPGQERYQSSGWKGKGAEATGLQGRGYATGLGSGGSGMGGRRPSSPLEGARRAASSSTGPGSVGAEGKPSSSSLDSVGTASGSTVGGAVGPPGGVYAHEDLLSTTPASAGKPKPTRVGFFTQSFVVVEAVLPPPSTSPLVPLHTPIPTQLPPSVLSSGLPNPAIRWRPQPLSSMSDDLALYKTLAKARLSAFVVLTAMAGYAMCPTDPMASQAAMEALAQTLTSFPASTSLESLAPLAPSASSALTNSLSVSVLLPATVGTTLCAFSAASFNQVVEGPYDAQMARTRARPVPRRFVTPLHATTFGAITGTIGMGTLYFVNPLSASLGLLTILLYCPIYTLMKRHTIYNTWLGAVVGAIPPLIGWSACTGSLSVLTQPGAWALFLMMFFWQFPHFNALAHTLRSSYASSGYRMLSVLDPAKNALVALRYSVALLPLSFLFPPLGLTNWLFPFLALAPNGIMAVTAFRFWQKREEKRAKQLFWASLVHLPVVLGMAMVCKKGLFGTEDEEVYDEEDEEDEEELVGQMVKV